MGRRAAELAGVLVASLITSFVTGRALAGPNEPVLYVIGALVPLALLLAYWLQTHVLLVEIWVGDERKRAGEQAKNRYR
jgi:hypothetical protein